MELQKSKQIIKIVDKYYGIKILNNLSTRKREYVYPRYVAMYFIKRYVNCTLKFTGELFLKDHATALHGRNLVKNLIIYDKEIKSQVIDIDKLIMQNILFAERKENILISEINEVLHTQDLETLKQIKELLK